METTRILWSGLTGRTGFAAIGAARNMSDIDIAMGISRRDMSGIININGEKFEGVKWRQYGQICRDRLDYLSIGSGVDVVVDASNIEVFDEVLKVAIRTEKPLIVMTSGLSDRQIASLYDATNRIPVFKGGNFRFKVKRFIDDAVKFAMEHEGKLYLYENFYKGKHLPSETAKVLQRRVLEATDRTIEIHSADNYDSGNLINDWELQAQYALSPAVTRQRKISCRVIGFDELAHDVLEIAKVMARKPIKRGEFYDLDEIWDDIPEAVKPK